MFDCWCVMLQNAPQIDTIISCHRTAQLLSIKLGGILTISDAICMNNVLPLSLASCSPQQTIRVSGMPDTVTGVLHHPSDHLLEEKVWTLAGRGQTGGIFMTASPPGCVGKPLAGLAGVGWRPPVRFCWREPVACRPRISRARGLGLLL